MNQLNRAADDFIELERRGGFGRPEEIQKTFRLLIQAAEMILEMDAR